MTVFCFLFFLLGPRGVRVSALGAGSEVDISRVPSGAPSRDLEGEGSRTGPKVGGAELRAGSTKPSHGGEGTLPEHWGHQPFVKFSFFLLVSLRRLRQPEEAVSFGVCVFVYGTQGFPVPSDVARFAPPGQRLVPACHRALTGACKM